MTVGSCEIVQVKDIHELSKLLQSLKNNQALCYGVPKIGKVGDKFKVVSESQKKKGEISRTAKDFDWPEGQGVMFLDHDDGMDKDSFIGSVIDAIYELKTIDKLWLPSSSSYIYHGKKQLTGLRGQRLYFFVDDAKRIPLIGETLYKRLWLAGYGHIQVSSAGSLLGRSPVDASVWQCNRLDFASGAKCNKPLHQEMREPITMIGCHKHLEFASVKLLNGTEEHQYKLLLAEEKNKLRPEAEKKQAKHIEARLEKVPDSKKAEMRKFYQAAYSGGDLAGNFEITLFKDGQEIVKSVREILANKDIYNKCKTLDPIEPEYNNYHKTGMLFLDDGKPNLYSKAHGGTTYMLTETIKKGKVQSVIDKMQQQVDKQASGELYNLQMPWIRLTDKSCALEPATVTIISGPTKAGKSFFVQNIIQYNHEKGVDWAYLPLEDDTTAWLWRMLAIIQNDFTMKHRDKTSAKQRKDVLKNKVDEIASYAKNLTENPRTENIIVDGRKTRKKVTPRFVLDWIAKQAETKRLVVVDPLAQIDFSGRNRWEAEEAFMREAVGIAGDSNASIIMVSHTTKGSGVDKPLTVDNIQGSAAYGRLAHTVIIVDCIDEREMGIVKSGGKIENVLTNRIVTIAVARNGSGSRRRLAFYFDDNAPRFRELGYLAKKGGK